MLSLKEFRQLILLTILAQLLTFVNSSLGGSSLDEFEGFGEEHGIDNVGINHVGRPLTAAQLLHGFSGNYGLGAGLGGLTLNDIAYDLSPTFTKACEQAGIKLGLPMVATSPFHDHRIPLVGIDSYGPKILSQGLLDTEKFLAEGRVVSSIPIDSDILIKSETGYKSDGIDLDYLVSDSPKFSAVHSGYSGNNGYGGSSGYSVNIEHNGHKSFSGYNGKNSYSGYNLSPFSMGDRLSSKLTSNLPFVTNKYRLKNGHSVVSGYSSHVTHPAPHGSSKAIGGESRVHFTQLHTEPAKITSLSQFDEPSFVSETVHNGFTPYSYEYPTEYESALTKRRGYVSETNGGFGSLLTGSYGSVLNNGYRSEKFLSNGGLKGLKFSFKKK